MARPNQQPVCFMFDNIFEDPDWLVEPSTLQDRVRWLHEALLRLDYTQTPWQGTTTKYREKIEYAARGADTVITI